jgi:hypothetical protein
MRSRRLAVAASVGFFLIAVASAAAQSGPVEVTDAWARATPGGAQAAAVYATIAAPTGDRLTGVSTPAAKKADLHSMTMDGSVMKMREVDGIDLPAGRAVTLKPGGYHIMLTGLVHPLKEGQSVALTFTFAKAGSREVTASVEKVGAMGLGGSPGDPHGGADMPMPR